jgi:hypothetical protein
MVHDLRHVGAIVGRDARYFGAFNQSCTDLLQETLDTDIFMAMGPIDVRTLETVATAWDDEATGTQAALMAALPSGEPMMTDLALLLVGDTRLGVSFLGNEPSPAPATLEITLETLVSQGDGLARCGDPLPSLLFAKSSSAELTVNGVRIQLSGMISLKVLSDGRFEMSVAEGEAILNDVVIASGNTIAGLVAQDGASEWFEPRSLTTDEEDLFEMVLAAFDAQAEAAEGACPPPPVGWLVYIVPSGDTLGRIATASGSSVRALMDANCIENPNLLYVGQSLYVPLIPRPPVGGQTQPEPDITPTGSEGGGETIGEEGGTPPTCIPGTVGCPGPGNIGG